MKVGKTIRYRGFTIERPMEDDYVVGIGADTLKEAKEFIDQLIKEGWLLSEDEQQKTEGK